MKIEIHKRNAKNISYGNKRNLNNVKYIVIHYTGNKGDTAKGNADYFATSNTRQAGAHYFVDKKGEIWCSVPLNLTAWAVGGFYTQSSGAGTFYGKCTNTNSVSIELCDCTNDVSWAQMLAVRKLVQYIQKQCPNAKTILRHWDVNGKACPAPMTGKNNLKWKHLHQKILSGYQYQAKVIRPTKLRSKNSSLGKVTGQKKKGDIVRISKVSGKWGRLLKKDINGNFRWIPLTCIQELKE